MKILIRSLKRVIDEFGSVDVTVGHSGSGTVSPAEGLWRQPNGTTKQFTAQASSDYYFDHWILDGQNVGSQNPYTCNFNGDHTLTAVFRFDSGGSGGCPYVYTWDGKRYIMDNNLLPASENNNGSDVEDYYKLEQPLVSFRQDTSFSLYSLHIREFEHEHDYLDKVQLLAVDHTSDVNIALTPKGEILTYRNPTPPLSCIDSYGNNRLSEICKMDGDISNPNTFFQGYTGDCLTLNFGRISSSNAKLILRDDMKCDDICIEVQIPSVSGDWQTVEVLHPRDYWAIEAVNLATFLPREGDFLVRLLWTAPHRLDYVGLDNTPQDSYVLQQATLVSAFHLTEGNVRRKLVEDDQIYAELTPGQQMGLIFRLPNCENEKRTFILYLEGHYNTVPS